MGTSRHAGNNVTVITPFPRVSTPFNMDSRPHALTLSLVTADFSDFGMHCSPKLGHQSLGVPKFFPAKTPPPHIVSH